jgi:hypothetical protein
MTEEPASWRRLNSTANAVWQWLLLFPTGPKHRVNGFDQPHDGELMVQALRDDPNDSDVETVYQAAVSMSFMTRRYALLLMLIYAINPAHAENASNPLAAVNNTDIRLQYHDLGESADLYDVWADGSYMLTPKLKLKYELHYWSTDVTGSRESAVESLHLRPMYFPEKMVGKWGEWKYKLAVGGELILDFEHEDQGIGSGSDQFAPLVGLALVRGDTVLVPLVQHFVEISGPDVNTTAFRMIAIQSLPNNYWGKLDAIVPVDWEHDNKIPATFEMQLGKMLSSSFGLYGDALFGVGKDRPYDWGIGIGVRFNY